MVFYVFNFSLKLPIFTTVSQIDLFEEKLIMSIFSNYKKTVVITRENNQFELLKVFSNK